MAHSIRKCNNRGLGRYFVYGHFRVDRCKLFYIGIGTKQGSCNSQNYQRAFAESNRNPYWKHIVNKTQYEVAILFESDDLEIVKTKEIELILRYKDRLTNISKGGDYPCDKILNKKQVFKYNLDGNFVKEYESIAEAARQNNISTSSLHNSITKNKINNTANSQWFYEFKGDNIESVLSGRLTKKKTRLYNNTEEYIFNSREECTDFLNLSPGRISDLIKIGIYYHYKIENYAN